ncbi:MAG: translation elongation factor Ts [Armatimonadetes bacterium CG2_30_59_28]|nr:translation elongation factor Ts [Armatimonadota bacterium]OIO93373.1 MAG: translation elongation factor Ts [Armatimonadetes bacterium CG2_30_59_28]PIU64994.1 MAG: translation elongation factor Ts [Armatimonadetes bacterium CG07_land_8_20_14_0_80_59_28]PIX38168.1 MAG: translation elongation factor Ts [Armatimonadetes bacterium CG_4_8_14_3_um_filter_58_9]PIY49164.1 MAG: translation elongation factor Ts [Armatimonadetes bacterium CG_4_10_14_3_um_filter_59_10]PJB63947.1 MAG: translation elonga
MSISAADVKKLRDRTAAGMMDCKRALAETDGDMEKAIEYLRKEGIAKAVKKGERSANQGLVHCYMHPGNKGAALVEVNCETDFVAKTDEFARLASELAMHIYAAAPDYVTDDEVPEGVLESERKIYREQTLKEGKPENIVDKIVEGRLKKFYEERCLINQKYVRDDSKTIDDLIKEAIAKVGENIKVGRFARIKVGES